MSYLTNNFKRLCFARLKNNRLFSNSSPLKEKSVQNSSNKDEITQGMKSKYF